MSRAVSSVADVTVFLLFVGAAAGVVLSGIGTDRPVTTNPAAEQATLLGTSTASVEYDLVVPESPDPHLPNASIRHRRTAHGTVAELLGEAAMSRVAVDDRRLSTAGVQFESVVASTTRDRLRLRSHRVAVRARWVPYPGAPVEGTFHVGPRPPPSTTVRAATLTVPSGMANVSVAALSAARSQGYDGVASVVARSVVDGLFPPERSRYALRGEYPADVLMADRYRQMGALTDTSVVVNRRSTVALNRELTAALAQRFRTDMRSRFDSPVAAARTVRTSRIRITVRTWSP